MKNIFLILFLIEVVASQSLFSTQYQPPQKWTQRVEHTSVLTDSTTELETEVLSILKAKCNVCHRKQNPFKIFSLKNLDKHAPKIKEQVFVKKRMPKGDKIKLTDQEIQTLTQWLQSKNL